MANELTAQSISDEIVAYTTARVARSKERMPSEQLTEAAKRMVSTVVVTGACMSFREALAARGLSVIGEVLLNDMTDANGNAINLDPLELATDYEWADAAAIAFPTEPRWLNGSDTQFLEVRDEVCVPLLRRDFVIDPYQIYEAKFLGADATTLDCSFLDEDALRECLAICDELNLDALVETTDADSLAKALTAGARIISIGITPFRLIVEEMAATAPGVPLVPEDCLLVVSGLHSKEDAVYACEHGADGIMAGSLFVDKADPDERRDFIRAITEIS